MKHAGNLLLNFALYSGLILFGLTGAQAQLRVFTVAGGAVNDGGPATNAALIDPHYAAYDKAGNLYVADYLGHRIRKINPSGNITSIAGNGISGFSGDGGSSKLAMVSFPVGITLDVRGNIIFTDGGNQRVREISPQGIISTIAGTGMAGYTGDGGPALDATFNDPFCVAIDKRGNIYICDKGNNVIRRINTAGIITTVAGNGIAGFSGDGGPATMASLNFPYSVLPDTSGNFYIGDYDNDRVRKVDASQIISTFAGDGSNGCAGDGGFATSAEIGDARGMLLSRGSLLIAGAGCSEVRTVDLSTNLINTLAGAITGYDGDGHPPLFSDFSGESGLLLDKLGNLVIVDRGNARIRVASFATQIVSTIAGGFIGDGGLGTASAVNLPEGINFDPAGDLYIADWANNRIREVTPSGTISTFAGTGISGSTGDGGPATAATLFDPTAVVADQRGNVYISDQGGVMLRKVNSGGTISTIPLSTFIYLQGLAIDLSGNLYSADPVDCVVWKITSAGTVSAVAGDAVTFQCGFNSDGIPAKQALLNSPYGVAVDSMGNVYIADSFNSRIRVVTRSTGKINTVAGNGICGFSGDGGVGTAAMVCDPEGVAVDSSGNVYIADTGNARIRSLNSSQIIQTVAGTGSFAGYNGNGLPALKTNLDDLLGVAVSPTGVVYWSDGIQSRIRKAQ
jgi:sugar lactone lactonase YvrE